ncbi:hypothetical protein DL765_002901 [Monosporascus sp. GIB2]|nr:hypothetical protein DL765_002901 [Monosporascus sp. GIB2]
MQSPSHPGAFESVSSSSSDTAHTPTHTTTNAELLYEAPDELPDHFEHFSIHAGVGTAPEDGGTYMIRDLDSGRAITLLAGRLSLERDAGTNGGWRWHCVERDDG